MDYKRDGSVQASLWVDCTSVKDADALIAWLQMAKTNFRSWAKANEQKDRTPKTTPREIKAEFREQVSSPASEENRANGASVGKEEPRQSAKI